MIELALRHDFDNPSDRGPVPPASEHRRPDIDLAFASTSRALALFGDSGAGKTTALNAIAGLLTPSRGRIVLDGEVLFDSAAPVNVPVAQRYGVTVWGVSDNFSWIVLAQGFQDFPLLFDDAHQPKQAFEAITRF